MSQILLSEGAAPDTPASGYLAIYATTGSVPAFKNDGGTVGTLASHESATAWTPVLLFGGGNTGMTFTKQVGRYARVGNLVIFEATLELSAKGSSTGLATITGLPYNTASASNLVVPFPVWLYSGSTITAGNQVYATITSNSATINLYNHAPTAAVAGLTDANFGATTTLFVSGSYITSGY